MGLLDRLLLARTALGVAARTGGINFDATGVNRRGRVLSKTAHLDVDGHFLAGDDTLPQRWQAGMPSWAAPPDGDATTLVIGQGADASAAGGQVLMALRRVDRPGEVWLAEVDPEFLFGELAPEANGAHFCVFASDARPVYCARESGTVLAPGRGHDSTPPVSWKLFLRGDFSASTTGTSSR
jgi:hypothetical protein